MGTLIPPNLAPWLLKNYKAAVGHRVNGVHKGVKYDCDKCDTKFPIGLKKAATAFYPIFL